jgi:hypothetical protein
MTLAEMLVGFLKWTWMRPWVKNSVLSGIDMELLTDELSMFLAIRGIAVLTGIAFLKLLWGK